MRSSAVLADSTNTPHEPPERHCCRLPGLTNPKHPNPIPTNSSPGATSRWSCSPLPAINSSTSFCEYLGRQLSYLPRLAKLLLVDQRCCFPLPASVAAPPRARRPRPRPFPRLRLRLRPRIVPRIRVVVRGQRAALRSTPLPSPSSWSPAVVVPEAEPAAAGGGGGGGLGEDCLCGGREGDSIDSSMFGLAPRARSTQRQQSKLQSPVAGKEGDSLVLGRRVRTLPKGLSGVVRWVGPTHFSAGVWVGVELDTRDGRNDGEVQGSRYFTCNSAHGVFVRPDHCVVLKGPGSVTAPSVSTPTSTSAGRERRPRGSFGATERATLSRKGSHASLVASEQQLAPPSSLPSNAWATGSEVGSNRKDAVRRGDGAGGGAYEKKSSRSGGSDDQIIGRLLASEAFSRVLAAAVKDRVRTEVAAREKQSKSEHEALLNRMCELEQMVDDAGGAMDDIASMVQSISENVETTATPTETDSRDAAAGGGGDAGGGGRDDARVAELTKLLCTVHDMSSQAADLLRSERKENQVRVQYLAERVNELESTNRNLLAGEGSAPSEPMEG